MSRQRCAPLVEAARQVAAWDLGASFTADMAEDFDADMRALRAALARYREEHAVPDGVGTDSGSPDAARAEAVSTLAGGPAPIGEPSRDCTALVEALEQIAIAFDGWAAKYAHVWGDGFNDMEAN